MGSFLFSYHIFTLENLGNFQITRNYTGLNLNSLHIIAAWTCPDKNNYGPLRVNILKNPCKAPIFYDFLVKKWVYLKMGKKLKKVGEKLEKS